MSYFAFRLAAGKPFKLGAAGVLCLTLAACASMSSDWRDAQKHNSVDAYQAFLARYPGSPNTSLAKAGLLEARWSQLSSTAKLDALTALQAEVDREVKATPRLRTVSEAVKSRRADLTWERLQSTSNPADLDEFLKAFPAAAARPHAEARLDDLTFEAARAEGSTSVWRSYLNRFSSGRHADEARSLAELPCWREVSVVLDEASIREHLALFPRGGTAGAARDRLAELVWERAERIGNDLRAYREYLELMPAGPRSAAARDSLDWAAAEDDGTLTAVDKYLKRYPYGRHAARARGALPSLRAGAPHSVASVGSAALAKVAEQVRESLKNASTHGAVTISGSARITSDQTSVSWTGGGMTMMASTHGGRSSIDAAAFELTCSFSGDVGLSGLARLRIDDEPKASLTLAGNRYVRAGEAWLPQIARYFARQSSASEAATR